jgi:hypothetical protein
VHNGLSAEQDRALEGLGAVPSDLRRLVEQYAGRARLTPGDADSLLATLAQTAPTSGLPAQPDQVVRTPDERVANESDHLGSSRVESDLVTIGVTTLGVTANFGRELVRTSEPRTNNDLVEQPTDQPTARVSSDLVEQPSAQPSAQPSTVQQPRAATLIEPPADTGDPKDGPLTRRMDARDVRVFPVARKAAFSAGILGADDLPEFPLIRSPSVAKEVEDRKSVASMPTDSTSTSSEQTDSFEILVDEEILEIEPDDPLFEESDED